MGLYARWTSHDSPGLVHIHTFSAAIGEWADGEITRQQIIDEFQLTGDEITELIAIENKYNSLNATGRARYLVKLHNVLLLCGDHVYTEAKAKSSLGF